MPAEPPKVLGLNHITLAVRGLDRAVAFYRDVLGLALRKQWEGGAYLEAGANGPRATTLTVEWP